MTTTTRKTPARSARKEQLPYAIPDELREAFTKTVGPDNAADATLVGPVVLYPSAIHPGRLSAQAVFTFRVLV